MLDVNISEKNEKVSCIIFDVDENLTLDTIRQRISDEADELLKGDYRFTISGVPLSLAQEQNVLVSKAIKWERGEPVIHYQCISHEEKQEHLLVNAKDTQSPNVNDHEEQGTCSKTRSEGTLQKSAFSLLQSPTTCSIKGIKLYSHKDIETSIGKEKERRIFWNKRARALCKENIKKADLYKQIHEDWRIYKTDLMTRDVKDLGSRKSTLKKATLQNNIARVDCARQKIDHLREAIINANDIHDHKQKTSELQRLRDELSLTKSELRKAQDALRKTTEKMK